MHKRNLLLALLFVSTSATAAFRDGNKLLSELNSSDVDDKIYAMGYIAGVTDSMHRVTHCAPGNVTLSQIIDMTRDYITRHSSVRNLPADFLISTMLADRWPCPKNEKGTKL